jgi:hypothetical protein
VSGVITDGGDNVYFGDTTGCPAPGANSVVADPKLATALADNGGSVQTLAILQNSAAIDRVPTNNCPQTTDQRGISRPQGPKCDSGAYENAPPAIGNATATAVDMTSGTVTATIAPNLSSSDTTVNVQYGTSTSYGSSTAAQPVPRASSSPASFSASLKGLNAGTTYHAEVVATNGDGTSTSSDLTFTTVPPPPGLAASLSSATTSGATLTLKIACAGGGPSGGNCAGPITLTSHKTTQGSKIVALTAKAKKKKKKPKPKPPPKVTKTVTVATGSYSVATGQTARRS